MEENSFVDYIDLLESNNAINIFLCYLLKLKSTTIQCYL